MSDLNRTKSVALLLVFLSGLSLCITRVQPAGAVMDSWTTKAQMPTPRSGLGVAVVNGRIYAIGGDGGGANEEFDPVEDTWTTKKPMPTGRSRFGIAVYQNRIYVIGGSTNSGLTDANEVYNPLTDTWEIRTPMPLGARADLCANVVNGKIYLIGGSFLSSLPIPSNLTEVYDPETDTWATEASMPTAVYGCTSTVVNNKIYVIENSLSGSVHSLNQIYDLETDTWSYGKSIPTRVPEAVAAATTGVDAPKRIYVIGGGQVSATGLNQVYDPKTDTWSTGAEMPTPRNYVGVVVLDDILYAIGGYGSNNVSLSVNEQYAPIGYGTMPPQLHILAPENKAYNVSSVPLVFTTNKPINWSGYVLDSRANVTIAENTMLTELSDGNHSVTVYANDTFGNIGFSSTVYFSVDTVRPTVSVLSPESKVYGTNEIQLNFTTDEPVSWLAYSLDGEDNVTTSRNITLAGLTDGSHNLTVYATDMVGNTGVSETVHFSIEPFPIILVVAVTTTAIIVVVTGYLILKRRKPTVGN
jgi:N-acetylneuraminic acid mutarotase